MQSEHIRERISKFDNKLYLEFGGKLFDDYHASRVLPGFEPDSKLRMLMQLERPGRDRHCDQRQRTSKRIKSAEILVSLTIQDVLRLMDVFPVKNGLYVGSVCHHAAMPDRKAHLLFKNRLEKLGIKVYCSLQYRRVSVQYPTDRQRRGLRKE